MSTIEDQPPPIPQPERVPVWDLVIADVERKYRGLEGEQEEAVQLAIADMRERDRVGRERYGTPLTTNNGRDHLVDAYQELLDGIVYLRAEIEQYSGEPWINAVIRAYAVSVGNALGLRGVIWLRDKAREAAAQ